MTIDRSQVDFNAAPTANIPSLKQSITNLDYVVSEHLQKYLVGAHPTYLASFFFKESQVQFSFTVLKDSSNIELFEAKPL